MGVAPAKIIFMIILSFEVALVSSLILCQKVSKLVIIGIKLSTRICAGVDDCPCFTTFYCYDPYWTKFPFHS